MRMLVVSPIAPFPQTQGNSSRIYHLVNKIMSLGVQVTFVYAGLEASDPPTLHQMNEYYDSFHFVPVSRGILYSGLEAPLIDDWYQKEVDLALDEILDVEKFDMMLVNYVWFSKAFEKAPNGCLRILDTHDVFGDRHKRLLESGVRPQWFYTTPKEEKKGLDRADCIIAIQEEEANYFTSQTDRKIFTVGHILPFQTMRPKPEKRGRATVGVIASGNPSNVLALNKLADILSRRPIVKAKYDFILAGAICNAPDLKNGDFIKLGLIGNVEEFYKKVDLCLNPHVGGTGLKIKSVEALAFGAPLIATVDAMIGIETPYRFHACTSPQAIIDLLEDDIDLDKMQLASQRVFFDYATKNNQALSTLLNWRNSL